MNKINRRWRSPLCIMHYTLSIKRWRSPLSIKHYALSIKKWCSPLSIMHYALCIKRWRSSLCIKHYALSIKRRRSSLCIKHYALCIIMELASCASDIKPYGATLSGSGSHNQEKTPTLSVSPTSVTLNSDGKATASVSATDGLLWNVADVPSWLSVTPLSGKGNATLSLTAKEDNPSAEARSATISLSTSTSTLKCQLVVTQPGINLSVGSTSISFAVDGGTQSVSVTSNSSWRIAEKPEWITCDSNGKGNSTLQLTASENTQTSERTAKLVIETVNGVTKATIELIQPGTAPSIVVAEAGHTLSTVTYTVTSNISWTVACPADWLSISPTSGTGNGTFKVTMTSNPNPTERKTVISVSGSGITRQIDVVQAAGKENLEVSATSVTFVANGGTKTVSVSANTAWSVSINTASEWLTVNKGENGLTLIAAENTKTEQREGTITIKGKTLTATVTVTQAAATAEILEVSATSVSFVANGAMKTLTVTSNGSWTVSCDADWITLNPTSGTGNGFLTVTCTANTQYKGRTATLTLRSGSREKVVQVSQAGVPSTLSLDKETIAFDTSSPADETVTVTSNEPWQATANAYWLMVEQSDSQHLKVSVTRNATSSTRSAVITVTGTDSGEKRTVTVSQKGMIDKVDFGDDKNL